MKLYRLETVQNLPISSEQAWDFLSDPKNLKTITPDYMGFKILSGEASKMYAGQIIQYIVTPLLNIPVKWVTEITHVEEGKYFVELHIQRNLPSHSNPNLLNGRCNFSEDLTSENCLKGSLKPFDNNGRGF